MWQTHLSLTYFLCIGILYSNKLSRQAKTSKCKEEQRDESNLNMKRGNLVDMWDHKQIQQNSYHIKYFQYDPHACKVDTLPK